MSKPLPRVLRFWALRSTDSAFRVELAYPDGSIEQTVVTFRHNPHPVCNDVEISDADAEAVFFAEDARFGGFDADTDAAWLECNKAYVKRMAS